MTLSDDCYVMNPATALLANSSLPISLYDFYMSGVPLETLATAYSLPLHWLEERIEAVRLCLQYQVDLKLNPEAPLFSVSEPIVSDDLRAA